MTTEKNQLRTAADWWQLLPNDMVKRLMAIHFPNKCAAELSINEISAIYESEIEAECESCDWKGKREEMDNEDDIDVCPYCGSEKIYYFK